MARIDVQNHLRTDCPMMHVLCSFVEKGCIWEGKLKDLSNHLKSVCPYQTVECGYYRDEDAAVNARCKIKILRKDRPKHLRESCEYYQIDCPLNCG